MIRRRIVERTGVERPRTGIRPDKTGNLQAIYRKGVAVTRVERREPAFPRALHFSHVDFPFFVGTMNSVAAGPRPLAPLKAAAERKAPARGLPGGAIPTVDFLLHQIGRTVKKTRVKILVQAVFPRIKIDLAIGNLPIMIARNRLPVISRRHRWLMKPGE
jgi:hypothetical protein